VLNRVIEDLTRPIDTIRHQAKTVTVGISRPQAEVSPLILDALTKLDVSLTALADRDRESLEALSPMITGVEGAMLYDITDRVGDAQAPEWHLKAVRALDSVHLDSSRYQNPSQAEGTKRRALRTGAAVTGSGRNETETLLVTPLHTPSGTAISSLLLLQLTIARDASLQQKISVLKNFGHKFDELAEHVADHGNGQSLQQILTQTPPALLFFGDFHAITKTGDK
jgi:glucosamine--fructose-6-phosphate aminotransferase (isomerizing)